MGGMRSARISNDDRHAVPTASTRLMSRTGASAYELAVEHGYEGTEAEWIEGQIPTAVMTADEYAALEPLTGTLYIVTG